MTILPAAFEAGYTHIHMLLDRTGSMEDIKDDTIGGVNAFIARQQATPGKCTFTLVQFDAQDPHEVVQAAVPIADAKCLTPETFVPRSSTPLYDAIGMAIADCTKLCSDLGAAAPEKVVFVIITDGQENASCEWNKARIQKQVQQKQTDGWKFVFLGVGLDAMAVGGDIGVSARTTISTAKSTRGLNSTYADTSDNIAAYRCAASPAAASAALNFTQEQRDLQTAEGAVPSNA